ncbi:hypothetical protein [Coleofasciculus sp. G2-EDA-02]|uniref:hypothetical protein n=1 Tax=Coleofasciculus sp. G2-EDA-02 TaxID=3069529 RepID=UPI0032FE4F9B
MSGFSAAEGVRLACTLGKFSPQTLPSSQKSRAISFACAEGNRELPRPCLNQWSQLDDYWLAWEFKWWVNHYTSYRRFLCLDTVPFICVRSPLLQRSDRHNDKLFRFNPTNRE